ncbi:tetracycline resistance protein, class D-like [Culex pipiens pallens]|uniref:tetracycline resistance protein, class D-like n=1 Tax=Culex pipiens pallens TaxID=42434 RepID=UPI0019536C51|nr:tetracycline resistance protein, class D-like [Culex pipiens pallens]
MDRIDADHEKVPLLNRVGFTPDQGRKPPSRISIEPMVFLHSLGWSLSEVRLTDQIVYQTCVFKLGSAEEVCSQLHSDDNATASMVLEQVVQPYAASVSMAIVLLTSVVPAVAALFFGPWSERFGRKPVIAIASIGYLLTYLLVSLMSFLSTYFTLTPWIYVAAHVPVSILGGFSVFNAGIYSFMNDITNDNNRTVCMGILQAFTMLGVLGGLLISSWSADIISTATSFLISAVLQFLSLLNLAFMTSESVPVDQTVTVRQQIVAIFNFELVKDMSRTLVKVRPNNGRTIMWLLIAVGGMVEFAIAGRVLFFLYTRRQFEWDVAMYSLWLSSELAIIMFGNFFGIFLMRKLFKMSDLGLLTLSTINHLGDYLIKGSARQGWQLFLTTFMSPFKGIDGAASRSILSTILPDDEVGKTYSLDLSIKAVTPLVSVFLFTYVYNSTIESAPYAYLFLTSGVFAVNLVIITIIRFLLKTPQEEDVDSK